ncbi:response regulator [Desulfuromonas soudanensis]|uniref:response regulator n=1 Tax=Desulfuromonas soudanensis TaxID=1603606 RepID=UPI0006AD43B7|nr:response regulator [Desulfuromonas soudanensis]
MGHSDGAFCATIEELLSGSGMTVQVCHDGHNALNAMEKRPPQVAIIDVALPGLFGFEVVDKIRARPGLKDVKIILLSSVYNKAAYKRTPSSLYGADDYIEKHHIPTDLVSKIRALLAIPENPVSPPKQPSLPQPPPAKSIHFVDEMNSKIQHAEEGEIVAKGPDDAADKARRLARIIISDIALYNQDKFEQGIRGGNTLELLAEEIREGRKLFKKRVDAEVCQGEDFLQTALEAFIERRKRELQH